jgi:hypothetical protein
MKRKRMSMVERQLRAAYGDRYPGSTQRWVDQQPERETAERDRLTSLSPDILPPIMPSRSSTTVYW